MKNFNLKIGIAGGIGTGKSLICKELSKFFDLKVIYSDLIARQSVVKNSSCLNEIIKKFGEDYLLEDGSLDRNKMRNTIVSNPIKKKEFEAIIHPEIINLIKKEINNELKKIIILEAPLLFELNLQKLVDLTIFIKANKNLRIERIMKRNNFSHKEAKALVEMQSDIDAQEKLADFIIKNNGLIQDAVLNLKAIIEKNLK